MTTTTETNPIELAELRAKRLRDVADGYEVDAFVGMPDETVPGADKLRWAGSPFKAKLEYHPRYVLVTQYGKGNYRLRLGADLRNIEQLAADAVTDSDGGELVYCYFDLDELAGENHFTPVDGDYVQVEHGGEEYEITRSTVYAAESDKVSTYYLEGAPANEYTYDQLIDPNDERMPVRYGLARVVTQVVFNTVPTER
jgi:hypothetical protein